MSFKTDLQSNNTDLQAILDTINALPEAGSGGGGSVETCTLTIQNNKDTDLDVFATCLENGIITQTFGYCMAGETININSVVRGSIFCIISSYGGILTGTVQTNGCGGLSGYQDAVRTMYIYNDATQASITLRASTPGAEEPPG